MYIFLCVYFLFRGFLGISSLDRALGFNPNHFNSLINVFYSLLIISHTENDILPKMENDLNPNS